MRFEGKRPSGVDKNVDVYLFSIGIQEMRTLAGILEHTKKNTVLTMETSIFRNRVTNMLKRINAKLNELKAENKKMK